MGDQRKKLASQDKCSITNGDILELIPGNHTFKYVTDGTSHKSSSKSCCFSYKGKQQAEDDSLAVKRKRQILEDEAVATALPASHEISYFICFLFIIILKSYISYILILLHMLVYF